MVCFARMFQRKAKAKTIFVANWGKPSPSSEELQAFFRYLDAKERSFVERMEMERQGGEYMPRLIFPEEEDILLDNLNEYGQSVEPSRNMPITPMVVANDCQVIVESKAREVNSESIGPAHEKVQTLCEEAHKLNREDDIFVLAKRMKFNKSDSQVEDPRKRLIGTMMKKRSENRCTRELAGALSKGVLRHARMAQCHVELLERYKVDEIKALDVEGAHLNNKIQGLKKQVAVIP